MDPGQHCYDGPLGGTCEVWRYTGSADYRCGLPQGHPTHGTCTICGSPDCRYPGGQSCFATAIDLEN